MNLSHTKNEESTEITNRNMFYLWWVDKRTQKSFCAGRAFYSERNGDFAICINLLQTSNEGKREEMYLRPVQVRDDSIYYRLEKVVRRGAKSHRFCIGEAFQSKLTGGDIHIHIEPLTGQDKNLVLCMDSQKADVA